MHTIILYLRLSPLAFLINFFMNYFEENFKRVAHIRLMRRCSSQVLAFGFFGKAKVDLVNYKTSVTLTSQTVA